MKNSLVDNSFPLVSIVALNYNNSRYVLDTLHSIAGQTYNNIELIIVDDCSTDDSLAKIENWLMQYDGNVRLIKHEKNKGINVTCNTGFKAATGKYISYIATDDIMLPEKIASQVGILEETSDEVGVVFSDAYMINEEGELIYGRAIQRSVPFMSKIPSGNIYNELIRDNFIPPMTALFKARIFHDIGYFDETLLFEDRDIFLRIARKYQLIFSEEVFIHYRVQQKSLSHTIRNWDAEYIKIFLKHLDHPAVIPKMEMLGKNLYNAKKYKDVLLLKNVKGSRYIRLLVTLVKLRVPKLFGFFILKSYERTLHK